MSWNFKTINISSWGNKLKNLLIYFWGTHDDKYVVDHEGRKIVFLDNSYTNKTKKTSSWSYKAKL